MNASITGNVGWTPPRSRKVMKMRLLELEYEFDIAKNDPLTFDQLSPGRRKPVIWQCGICGQNWPATVGNRLKGTGCPFCNHRKPIVGVSDFKTLYPQIASEWDYYRNADKRPENYLPHSNANVSWLCEKGHPFEARINNRVRNSSTCPCCAGRVPIPGESDLGTLYPDLVKEWAFDLNGDKKPSDFLPKSNAEIQWRCILGHTWPAKICHRTEGTGCPYCEGKLPIVGENDFATLHPQMAKQWHPSKNNSYRPEGFLEHSHFVAWWICPLGHEYPSPIYRRARGCGCSVCDGKRILSGVNDLATLAPKLSRDWDYERNADITPAMVAMHSSTRYYWKCQVCGYQWFASPNNRCKGTGCPKCAHFIVDPFTNSVAAINEVLATQWDVARNAPLTARDVAAYDNRDYYWICEDGHSFQASPANRNNGTECPYCKHKKPIIGENDLASQRPDLCKYWHPFKNRKKTPEDYFVDYTRPVWWQCENGHSFRAPIREMVLRWRCPRCEIKHTAP